MIKTKSALSDNQMVVRAVKDSFIKLSPKVQAENPVMLLVYISAILTSLLWVASLSGVQDVSSGYTLAIAIILWLTCIFANFAEAIAEGRGKAQADALRAAKKDVEAYQKSYEEIDIFLKQFPHLRHMVVGELKTKTSKNLFRKLNEHSKELQAKQEEIIKKHNSLSAQYDELEHLKVNMNEYLGNEKTSKIRPRKSIIKQISDMSEIG